MSTVFNHFLSLKLKDTSGQEDEKMLKSSWLPFAEMGLETRRYTLQLFTIDARMSEHFYAWGLMHLVLMSMAILP